MEGPISVCPLVKRLTFFHTTVMGLPYSEWSDQPEGHGVRKADFATRNFPIQEVELARRGTWRCVGLLAVRRARGCFARVQHRYGRVVHRNSRTQGRGRPGTTPFS